MLVLPNINAGQHRARMDGASSEPCFLLSFDVISHHSTEKISFRIISQKVLIAGLFGVE